MPHALAPVYSFNSGEVSKLALARLDLQKMRVAGETVRNWLPTILGPMMFRPGFEHIGTIPDATTAPPSGYVESDGSPVEFIPYVRSPTDTALIECTTGKIRVWVNDELITRPSVSASITNGTFSGSLTGWTTALTGGATAAATASGLAISANSKGGTARVYQSVSTSSPNVEHALRIIVTRGPVTLRVGSTSGGDEYQKQTTLTNGTHSISFTPTGTFYVEFGTTRTSERIVQSISIEAAGVMSLPTEWDTVSLRWMQYTQSIDVQFVADGRHKQKRIERRSQRSWSIVDYTSPKGPLRTSNQEGVKLSVSSTEGIVTVTSNVSVFRPQHVGSTLRMFHSGQEIRTALSAGGQFTDAVRMSGIGSDRGFGIVLSGTWVGTVRIQRSFDGPDSGFNDWTGYAANGTYSVVEPNNNSIVWIRIGFKDSEYTSGTASVILTTPNGGGEGFGRVIAYTSPTQVTVDVDSRFSYYTATSDWYEGEWSDIYGWPSSVALYDGRLWWSGADKFMGSVSDSYDNFDLSVTGDSAPIIRSLGYGGVESARWLLPMQRLVLGGTSSEISIRSSAFDSPLTPTDLTARTASTYGSAHVRPVIIDRSGIFVAKDQRTICEMAYSVDAQDYVSKELTELHPRLFDSPAVDTAVQRHPDTRIWFACLDGTARCLTYERANEVVAWSRIMTDGEFLSFTVLPSETQDRVYAAVRRNGVVYLEKMALDSEAIGAPVTCNVDAFVRYTGGATTTIAGLSHLNGKQVYVWTSEKIGLGPFTVASGQITLPYPVTNCVVGLAYNGDFVSAKLGHVAAQTALAQRKRQDRMAISFCDTHHRAIQWGSDLDRLDYLPAIVSEEEIGPDKVWDQVEIELEPINGNWSKDERFVIRASSPYPATVQAAVISLASHDAA